MSNSNGINTLDRSINGIITYSDGSGTLIQNGKIITITLTANIINAINLIISNIGCNGILTIGSAATTEIKIIPTANLTLGSATSTDTLIQNSDGVIMGQTPASYNPVTGLMNAPGMRFENKSGSSFLDFHSNTVGSGQTDSRIISTGGTATALHGTLAMTSGTIYLSAMDTTNISNLTTNINSSTKIELVSPLINLNATVVKVNYILPLTLNGIIKLGDITQGSSQIDYCVYIQGKRNALSYYKAASGQTYPTFVESVSNGIVAGFDFHTSGNNSLDYDARIECGSAITGSTTGTAIMSIVASAVKMDKILPYTSGGPILLGDETLFPSSDYYGVRLQGSRSALAYYKSPTKDNPTFIETTSTGGNAHIDFHSEGQNITDYDARILCIGATVGTTTSQTGTLEFYANKMSCNVNDYINMTPVNTFQVDTTTVNILPTGNLNLGSSTSVNTLIKGTDGVIIGATPASYNPSLGTMNAPGFRMTHGTGGALIDFHTNTVGSTNFDSRIYATLGTAAQANGTLELQAGTLNLTGTTMIATYSPSILWAATGQFTVTSLNASVQGTTSGSLYCSASGGGGYFNVYNSSCVIGSTRAGSIAHSNIPFVLNAGLVFNRGAFAGSVGGMMFTAGGYVHPNNLGANNATSATVSFGMTFGAGPVYLTVYTYSIDAASMGVVSTFQGTTATEFVANFYNSRTVTAPGGTFGLNYVAFGKN